MSRNTTLEAIAANILTTLQAIDEAGLAMTPYRKSKAHRDTPDDGDCEIAFVAIEKTETQYHGFYNFMAVFELRYYVLNVEDDATPIDGQFFDVWAVVHDALQVDHTRGGNAQNTEIGPAEIQWNDDNQQAALVMTVTVLARHPYKQMTIET